MPTRGKPVSAENRDFVSSCHGISLVGSIFHTWGQWSEPDETDLQLHEHELLAYMDPNYGKDKRILEFEDVASTFLHSYGNALTACPCLCRTRAFSHAALVQRGLRGFFIQSTEASNPRFLHPREVALILGIPESVKYIHNPMGKSCFAWFGRIPHADDLGVWLPQDERCQSLAPSFYALSGRDAGHAPG